METATESVRDAIRDQYATVWLGDVRAHLYSRQLHILDARHAGLPGHVCPSWSICPSVWNRDERALLNWRQLHLSPDALVEHLSVMVALFSDQECRGPILADGLDIYYGETKAVRVFHPGRLDRWKPLHAAPAKWNLGHVVRGLVNGQLSAYNEYTLTDDYAWDNVTNCQRGQSDPLKIAKELIKEPSGWWVSQTGNQLNLGCHSFRSMRLDPVAPFANEEVAP